MATPIPDNHACFTLAELAELTGGRCLGAAERKVSGVVTDSRRVEAGALFVALRGENHDGHAFLPQVAQRGAAALVREGTELPTGLDAVAVPDTLEALSAIARGHRRRWGGRLVAITGSAGKTSTKELAAAALRGAGRRVRATVGNLNNRVGVPMTLLTLAADDELAVIELGTSEPGEIAALAAMAEPDVGVVTLVSEAHTAGLGGLEEVRREKTALLRALGDRGVGIVAGDDPSLAGERALRFGAQEEADARLLDWGIEGSRTHAVVQVAGRTIELRLRLLGEAAARNAAAALLIAQSLGADLDAAAGGMEALAPLAGRMCPIDVGGALVIDDSYNANPRSMELALRTARKLADRRGARLLAVLGDMKELGSLSVPAHRRLRQLAEELADVHVFVGSEMARVGEVWEDLAELPAHLDAAAPDVVLVKGSRSMGLERVVDALRARGEGEP